MFVRHRSTSRDLGGLAIVLTLGAMAALTIVVAGCGGTGGSGTTTSPAGSPGGTAATIRVQSAYVVITMPSEPAAGYLVLVNDGDADDALIAVSSPAFGSIGLHETSAMGSGATDSGMDGMVGMQPVAEIPIPAHGNQALAPGGYHLMLENATSSLAAGATVDLTLTFRHAAPVTVQAEVRTPASGS